MFWKLTEPGNGYLLRWLKVGCRVHVVLAAVVDMRWAWDSDVRDTLMCLWAAWGRCTISDIRRG